MLGDRIKLIRKANKLNQREFGEALNVTKQTVSNWENNNIQPSVDMVRSIALKFNISSDFILEIDDRPGNICIPTKLPVETVTHINLLINDIEEVYDTVEKENGKNNNSDM